jgi:outer membrane protein assembly factor BamA
MIKIYNIGNFARVEYQIDTMEKGENLLIITAKDAFTIVPILSFSGSREDWQLGMGFSDNNFLGRNINLNIQGTVGTRDKNFRLQFNIPRQLMYRNMSIGGGVLYGNSRNYVYENGQQVCGIGYKRKEIYGNISNPWNEDFTYRFSPDFGWKLFQHKTDSTLLASDLPSSGNYTVSYLALSISESIGYIQNIRHQQRGYEVHLGIGAGIGLNSSSPAYFSVGGGASYHKLFNHRIQWSTELSTSYTTTDIPSLLYYLGGNQVKGIITGEIYGKAVYHGNTGLYITYLNRDWFAIEQSVYVNIGNGAMVYTDLFRTKPLASVGTGVKLWIPMIPWLYVKVFFTYSKNKTNWFQFQF